MGFNRLFSIGLVLLGIIFGGSILFSTVLSPSKSDWLVDSRYVELTPDRYRPGSVTHFDLQAMDPPRNSGFYLLAGADGRFVAVFDRPGCLLEYKPDLAALYNPCRQRVYPVQSILAGETTGDDLIILPIIQRSGQLVVDIGSTLPGR